MNLALCYLKVGNNPDCRRACEMALAFDARCEKALFRRGQCQLASRNFDQAIEDFETVLEINPSNEAAKQQIEQCHQGIKAYKIQEKELYHSFLLRKKGNTKAKVRQIHFGRFQERMTEDGFCFLGRGCDNRRIDMNSMMSNHEDISINQSSLTRRRSHSRMQYSIECYRMAQEIKDKHKNFPDNKPLVYRSEMHTSLLQLRCISFHSPLHLLLSVMLCYTKQEEKHRSIRDRVVIERWSYHRYQQIESKQHHYYYWIIDHYHKNLMIRVGWNFEKDHWLLCIPNTLIHFDYQYSHC